jgi:hypothetical protein
VGCGMALWVLVGLTLGAGVSDGEGHRIGSHAGQTIAPSRLSEPYVGPAVTLEDVEIIARRGAAKVPPVVELDGQQIDAIGAWDIGEVLKHLKDIYSGNGEPLILINGQRVPLPTVFNGFPPDAAVRVEVLPPEASGLYGGQAGQAVFNLVLQPRYSNMDLGLSGQAPTQGGSYSARANAQRGSIRGMNSHQLRLGGNYESGLTNRDRDIRDLNDQPEHPDVSLRPEAGAFEVGAMTTRALGDWGVVGNLNLRSDQNRSVLAVADQVYSNRQESQGLNLSMGLSGEALGWRISADASSGLNGMKRTGYGAGESRSRSLGVDFSAYRPLLSLPAGEVQAHLKLGLAKARSETEHEGQWSDQSSENRQLGARLHLPLIAAKETGLGRIGAVQADIGVGRQQNRHSAGQDTNLSLAWQPKPRFRLNLGLTESLSGAFESLRTLPLNYGAPRTVYDFRRGEAVEVVPLLGGNPDLTAPELKGMNLGLSAGPLGAWQFSSSLNYRRQRSTNGISSLAELTEEVQALFPERFVRDTEGRLVEVDFRPLNIGRSLSESLGGDLSLAVPIRDIWPKVGSHVSSLQIRMGFERQLQAVSQLLPGQPSRDQLNGDGGGRSRQDLRLSMDTQIKSVRASLNARWQEGYRSRRLAGVDGPDDLVRDDHLNVDLRMGWRFNRKSAAASPDEGSPVPRRRLSGTELSLDISNLFDTRPRLTLGSGERAPGYGRDRLDPMGRTVSLGLRQRF